MIGIYKITNKINNKPYIGSSNNIKRRWRQHISLLNNNKHHSIKLQRAWNKYGQDNFKFEILEECEVEKLLYLEQFYIDKYKAYFEGYNSKENTRDIYTIDDYIKDEKSKQACEYIEKFMGIYDTLFTDKSMTTRINTRRIKEYEILYMVDIINFIIKHFKDAYLIKFKNNSKYDKYHFLEFDNKKLTDIRFSIVGADEETIFNFIYFFNERTIFYIDENNINNSETNISKRFIGKIFYQRNESVEEYNNDYMKFIQSIHPFNIRKIYKIKYGHIEGFMNKLDDYYRQNNLEYGTLIK